MYSEAFRNYVAHITGCGPLSGRKTDMAINVYTPGCYLLCHDDVIGSRRVSYILYLTDPDTPWQPEWGGALRLYPVDELKNKDGEVAKTPLSDASKVIPPAWNQLSFFAVQPGESFHDVEEVYHAKSKEELEKQGGRVRMAISGWFHIPQEREDGFVKGEEEKNAKNSSLMQLQGNPAQYDMPQPQIVKVDQPKPSNDEFEEADLEFLLKYMAPTYLTPDTLEQVSEHFEENSSITLADILSKKFSARLKKYVEEEEKRTLPDASGAIEKSSLWRVAKPPHKHRYLYQQPNGPDQLRTSQDESPLTELLDNFLPSRQFRHWLQVATGCTVENHGIMARRFRRGKDYTLATGHEGKSRLEVNIGITPSGGWGDDADEDDEEVEEKLEETKSNGKGKGKGKAKAEPVAAPVKEVEEVGGHEVYMAGEDDTTEDAAIYKSSGDEDNILFFQAAAWNKMVIVLRDSGTLKFVKYVSANAKGDRWDIAAAFDVEEQDDEEDDEEGADGEASARGAAKDDGDDDDDESDEFNGFSDSGESESD